MLNGNFIPVDRVIEKVYRDFPFDSDIDIDSLIEWTGEALELIGIPMAFKEFITDGNKDLNNPESISISNHRGMLPCVIIYLESAFKKEGENLIPMITSTSSTFFSGKNPGNNKQLSNTTPTYKLNNNHIFTSFEEGEVVIEGTTILTDERGFPMIPDNIKFVNAVSSYIQERIGFKLLMLDKITPGKYSLLQQERYWYMGAANITGKIPNLDEMESWKNILHRAIPLKAIHQSGFNYINNQERRFNNNSNY